MGLTGRTRFDHSWSHSTETASTSRFFANARWSTASAQPDCQVRQYFHRYTNDAIDLCDVLGSFGGQAKVKLDELSKIIGLPGKPEDTDGSRVEEMVNEGRLDDVAGYCESDVLNTYRIWLIYELFRGSVTEEQFAWSEVDVLTRTTDIMGSV